MAYLELHFAKRMAKTIVYTRLLTGHTHEDIDACFGCIWSFFCNHTCETMDGLQRRCVITFSVNYMSFVLFYQGLSLLKFFHVLLNSALELAFGFSKLHAVVEDVFVIPDYEVFLAGCIDDKLGWLHKEIQTQHQ